VDKWSLAIAESTAAISARSVSGKFVQSRQPAENLFVDGKVIAANNIPRRTSKQAVVHPPV
jgi:hypothetical protein